MKHFTVACLCLGILASSSAKLVAWWKGDDVRDSMGINRVTLLGDASIKRYGFDFSGGLNDVAFVPDSPEFAITGSLSISCRVFPRAYVSPFATSPDAQIVFRGDDRSGNDPYHITLSRAGRVRFAVEGPTGMAWLETPLQLNKWVHLLGVLDADKQTMKFYVNGKVVAECKTAVTAFGPLDGGYAPGVSIGNVQFPQGGLHRQPFDGFIRDVRIYDSVVTPKQIK